MSARRCSKPDVRHTHRLPAEDDKSRRTKKQYALNGVPGLVEQRKVRQTGGIVQIYRVDQSDLNGIEEPWAIVCASHRHAAGVGALGLAKEMISDPKLWCPKCGGER